MRLPTLTRSQSASLRDPDWRIAYASTDDAVDIWLHGIVGDEYMETDSMSIGQVLARHKGQPVTLHVNSPGGLAYDGVAIYNTIDAHDGPTTGIIEGKAGSAASLAVIACDTVKAYSSAVFVPHYALVMAYGHQAEIRDALDTLQRLDEDLEQVYMEASGQTLEKVKQDLIGPNGDGTVFSAQQAMDAGYVDEIIHHNKNKAAASRDKSDAALALRRSRLRLMELDKATVHT